MRALVSFFFLSLKNKFYFDWTSCVTAHASQYVCFQTGNNELFGRIKCHVAVGENDRRLDLIRLAFAAILKHVEEASARFFALIFSVRLQFE